ncbi:hypothetical protein SAY87_020965 [Trapa incisa]|uniref:Phytosulfokine n=1 Tax=Trapa incisa TaxID=236973 RepID=A0AAN7JSB9_9MYRT|nr:hypothetical protein SAY87_020965 [Trapa incisa]
MMMTERLPWTSFRGRALLVMVLALFILSTFSRAARPNPVLPLSSPSESNQKAIESEEIEVEVNCETTGEEEECLMRRTLAAHIDYIYTQKQKN